MLDISGEMTELAEGARLEIVCAPKAYLGFESLSLRQKDFRPWARVFHHSFILRVDSTSGADEAPASSKPKTVAPNRATRPMRRGGRVVECGGLENRFTRNPGNEGSNPSSSASFYYLTFLMMPVQMKYLLAHERALSLVGPSSPRCCFVLKKRRITEALRVAAL